MEVTINGVKYVPAASSEVWPKAIKQDIGCAWVFYSNEDGVYFHGRVESPPCKSHDRYSYLLQHCGANPITDKALRERLIAAAEAWRKEQSDPWPHWYRNESSTIVWKYTSPNEGVVCDRHMEIVACDKEERPNHIRIPASEAASIRAGWEKKGEEARVYRARTGMVRVFFGEDEVVKFWPDGKFGERPQMRDEDYAKRNHTLLTGPERDEYIAAAREGRDAVWPRKESGEGQYDLKPHAVGTKVMITGTADAIIDEIVRVIPTTTREPSYVFKTFPYVMPHSRTVIPNEVPASQPTPSPAPAPLPTAEDVAALHRKIAQMEKHLRWIAYEPIGPANNTAEAILDEITNTTRAVIFELAKPECRVKHDWTGAMGTVLMEHDGTAFVKWDDGQVTSVYNRHLQKELE